MKKSYRTKHIFLVGPYPPPIGGVSIYIQRISQKLGKEFCTVIDTRPLEKEKGIKKLKAILKQISKVFLIKKGSIVHYNSANWNLAVIFVWIAKIKKAKFVRNTHGFAKHIPTLSLFKKKIINYVFKNSDKIICVSNRDKQSAILLGAVEEKIKIIPAYISPVEKEEDFAEIPEYYWDKCEKADMCITANAGALTYDNDGIDLYGLDMCIELSEYLKDTFKEKRIIFLFFLGKEDDIDLLKKYKKKIKEKSLEENFYIIQGNKPFYPILTRADYFIRPTTTDGDAISIREAMSYGVTAICSDSVERVREAVLFENRNQSDMNKTLKKLIETNLKNEKKVVDDFFEEIIKALNEE